MNPRSHRIIHRAVPFCCVLIFVATLGYASPTSYLGFDANDYPGDAALPSLRHTFSFSGYWLNIPPGADSNGWVGKRSALLKNGFGFLLLFNGRTISQLKTVESAAEMIRARGVAVQLAAALNGNDPVSRSVAITGDDGYVYLMRATSPATIFWLPPVQTRTSAY